ncbi:MAG: Do family serine endopeptidase [Planctomycetota bacterium]
MNIVNQNRRRILLVFVLIALLGAVFHQHIIGHVAYAVQKGQLEAGQEHLAQVESISKVFRQVAKVVKPAVVRIETTFDVQPKEKSTKKGKRYHPDMPELRDFFEKWGWNYKMPDPTPKHGLGSGVIIDADEGYILTNNHVVTDSEGNQGRVDVYLPDRRRFKAKIVGRDPNTDLALIQIKDTKLHALSFGDSDKMEVGDWVLAIGAPFRLEQTVTQGIISAKGRSKMGIINYEDFIQTDAAINPGNSGGPLVNMKGDIIGINTAIITNGLMAGYMGIGFAIPTKTINEVLPILKEGKEVVRGYLGVTIRALSEFEPGIGKTFGLDKDEGILIEDVKQDTPADKAGLRDEDIVLDYQGKPLDSAADLQDLVARTKPDTKVDLLIWRDGKKITIPVTIEKQPKDFFDRYKDRKWGYKWRSDKDEREGPINIETLGMTVQPMSAELAKQYRWDYDDEDIKDMLIVTEVEPLGEARALGIRTGQLIISVQGKRIASGKALKRALDREAIEKGVRIRILTKNGPFTLFFQNEGNP